MDGVDVDNSIDNSFDNLTPVRSQILAAVGTRSTVKQISKGVKRPKSNVSRTLKYLKNNGLVDKRQGLYYLTSLGIAALRSQGVGVDDNSLAGSNDLITRRVRSKLRAHHVSFTLRFWSVPSGWERLMGTCFGWEVPKESEVWSEKELRRLYGDLIGELKDAKFNNEFRGGGTCTLFFEDYTVVCSPSSVRVWIPEVVTDTPDMAQKETADKLLEFVPRLERLLRLPHESLWKNGRLNVRTSSAHYAWLDSAFAKYAIKETEVKESGFKVRDRKDGKTRVLIDRSQGGYEFEACHRLYYLDDAEVLDGMVRPYIEGRAYMPDVVSAELDNIKATLGALDGSLQGVTETLGAVTEANGALSENIVSHVGIAKDLAVAALAVREAISTLNVLLSPVIRLNSWLKKVRGWFRGVI